MSSFFFFFFQAEDGIRDLYVTGVQTCALPISLYVAFGNNGFFNIPGGVALHNGDKLDYAGLLKGPLYQGTVEFWLKENRSEERRVGKECRSRWSPEH